jgi:hypothetical protein
MAKKTKRAAQEAASPSIIDAIVTLSRAGLLDWQVSGRALVTQPRFTLYGVDLILNADAAKMHVSREQACAIAYAANDFKAAQKKAKVRA